MPRSGTEFTNSQKARIFCRDRATCCFSGANLWLLDSPLRHNWEADWTDHILPSSKGGISEESNGVCSSATFNVKKRNNSNDKSYLFREGIPTPLYFSLFGPPPTSLTERLDRLSRLSEIDWYFNRAICWVLQALYYNCWAHSFDSQPTRKDDYWFLAGYRKLEIFQRSRSLYPSIEERKIVEDPTESQAILLSLRDATSLQNFTTKALQLSSPFNKASKIWDEYFCPDSYEENSERLDEQRKKAYGEALKNQDQLSGDTFRCIESDFRLRGLDNSFSKPAKIKKNG